MNNFPIVRLEVERLHHSIMACLGPALEAEQNHISELVKAEVEKFNFGAIVKNEVYTILSQSIHEAVKNAVRTTFLSDDVQAILSQLAKEQIKSVLTIIAENECPRIAPRA